MFKGEYSFKVRTCEYDAEGLATMPSICNYLQEAASIHVGDRTLHRVFSRDGKNYIIAKTV